MPVNFGDLGLRTAQRAAGVSTGYTNPYDIATGVPGALRPPTGLREISERIASLFGPEQKSQLLQSTRSAGTQAIGQATSAANRGAGSALAAQGMLGGSVLPQAIQQNYAGGAEALAQLEAELARLGIQYDAQTLQQLLSMGQLDAQRRGLGMQQSQLDAQNDPFNNMLNLGSTIASIGLLL